MSVSTKSIELCSIAKKFYTPAGEVSLFDHICYTFMKGTLYALTGSSGSGKSTLLYCIAGLEAVSSGTIYINTVLQTNDTRESTLQSGLGLMFQSPYLINELSALDNILLKTYASAADRTTMYHEALELLKGMGLGAHIHTPAWMLSGGQQQRVALARALICKPDFILADEPTGNLDKVTGAQIVNLLLDYQRTYGMGFIIATHDTQVAQKMDVHLELKNFNLCQKK